MTPAYAPRSAAPRCALLAVLALTACNDLPSSVADDFTLAVPAGYIGMGSTIDAALVNDGETAAMTGSLPCVVIVEQRLDNKWQAISPDAPCPGVAIPVPAGASLPFTIAVPDEIGTYRLRVSVMPEGAPQAVTIRSRAFQTVGIVRD